MPPGRHPAAFLRRAGCSAALTLSRSWRWAGTAGKGAANWPWQGSTLRGGHGGDGSGHGGDGSVPLPGLGHGAACSRDAVLGGKGSAPLLALMWG